MNKVLLLATAFGVLPGFGSTLTTILDQSGSTYTVTALTELEKPAAFLGMLVTADFAGGSTTTCNFTGGGGPGGNCIGTGFNISFNNNNDLSTAGGTTWTITNSSGLNLNTITFNGLTGSTPTLFTPCAASGPGGTTSGTNCLTASSPAGTSTAAAVVTYLNAAHLGAQTVPDLTAAGLQWNAFATLKLDFTGFTTGTTFGFSQDADSIGSFALDSAPEPGGIFLLGGGLMALAAMKRFKSRA